MKKILTVLFVIPFLLGCKEQEYTGYKLTLESDESGELTLADPETLYQKAITDGIDCVFYIGDDTCGACLKLKPQLKGYVEYYKLKIYYIPLNTITTENVSYINDATTDSLYTWGDNQSVPATYFFSQKCVVFRGDGENTMNFLMKYVNHSAE